MFRTKTPEAAPTFWIATSDLPETPANAFYQKLDAALAAFGFGEAVRALAAPFYQMDASKGGQPGIDPEVYFKMLMVGFFENLASERAIASRCADSLSIRAFLHYGLGERTPHHSSFTVIRQRLAPEVYEAVFALVFRALRARKLLKGKHLAIDTSVLEANASLRSLRHRLTGEHYRQYVKRLAEAAGVDPTDPRAVSTFDRKRKGRKTSNTDWHNPHDPDAKVGPDKKGVTRMLYKPEHVVDLETGAVLDAELHEGNRHDARELAARVVEVELRVNTAVGAPTDDVRVETVVADMGYCVPAELVALQAAGIRTAIPDPVRNRRMAKLPEEERRALHRAKRTTRSQSGQALMKRRGEFGERSFMHVLDYGGARRTTLRGRENIRKRYLIQVACANLSLLLRTQSGIGTLKQSWAASGKVLGALLCALLALLRPLRREWRTKSRPAAVRVRPSRFPGRGLSWCWSGRTSTVCYREADWSQALLELRPRVDSAEVVLSSYVLKPLYYFGRGDVHLSWTETAEAGFENGQPVEFSTDRRTGLPTISTPESLRRVMDCFTSGLILTEQFHLNRPHLLPDATTAFVLANTEEVPLPPDSWVRAFRWRHAVRDSRPGCPPWRPAASALPPVR